MSITTHEQLADVTGIDESAVSHSQNTKSVYVYEAPVRLALDQRGIHHRAGHQLFHWRTAAHHAG